MHKGLYSGHNDHNYFEIAHTQRRLEGMGRGLGNFRLYNFVDNHDVERIYTKLNNKAILHLCTFCFIHSRNTSIYYGSEFAIEGERKEVELRPHQL